MRLVFWQNIISPHQSSYLVALATMDCDVLVVAHEAISVSRQQQGWGIPELPGIQVIIAPNEQQIKDIIQQENDSSVHIFAGARENELGLAAMWKAVSAGVRIGMLSESPDSSQGFKSVLRRMKYSTEALSIGRKFDFIMAMGQLGVQWFSSCGYSSAKVFPFGYFTEARDLPAVTADGDLFHITFVGQCIHRKGIDILLRALSSLKDMPWELTIIGDGTLKSALQQQATALGISERVNWKGQLENSAARAIIASSDLLVLPSRFDGWGAVVNEALQCGVPVVCSDKCGAADLLHESWRGESFVADSIESLASALRTRLNAGKLTSESREKLLEWATCIEGEVAAQYFLAVLQHVYEEKELPTPSWY
ncbi:MAG: glycosyltransferase [bacterium]